MTKVVFMGTPDFSVGILQTVVDLGLDVVMVVTQPDRPKGRKKELTPPPVKEKAIELGLKVYQPEKIRLKEQYEVVLQEKPDLIITAAYGQILPKELLDGPEYGCINVHASLLPELRGGAPIHYSILQGKKETGVTIMYMVEKLDAGDMLTKIVVPIEERDTVGSLHDKLSIAGAELLKTTVPQLLAGELTPEKQDEEKVTFAPNIKREQEQIDWSRTGEDIYNQIRGLNPWPVAFTTCQGTVWKVWWGEKLTLQEDGVAGQIVRIYDDGIVVKTGNHTGIKLMEIQPAGKKRMSVQQFLRGTKADVLLGIVLGENQ